MIRRIVICRTRVSGFLKGRHTLGRMPDKSAFPLGHNADVVKELEDLRRRLMNGAKNRATDGGVSLEQFDETSCHEGVETGSGFIAEDQRRLRQNLRGKGQSLRFSARYALENWT